MGSTGCQGCAGDAGGLDRCTAAVDYDGPWPRLVQRFKFEDQPGWAPHFAQLMWSRPELRPLALGASVWMPIPLTANKLVQRGYNQAWELLKSLHDQHSGECPNDTGIVRLPNALQRHESPSDQHQLGRQQRLRNVSDVFWVNPSTAAHCQAQTVLLVDDVMTTGSTLQAAARALKAIGAKAVYATVFARTPRPADT